MPIAWTAMTRLAGSLLVAALLFPALAAGQAFPVREFPLPPCDQVAQGQECGVVVDRVRTVGIGTVRVWNSNRVFIEIENANPFEECSMESRRPRLQPTPHRAETHARLAAAIARLRGNLASSRPPPPPPNRNTIPADQPASGRATPDEVDAMLASQATEASQLASYLNELDQLLTQVERHLDTQFVASDGRGFRFGALAAGAENAVSLEEFTERSLRLQDAIASFYTLNVPVSESQSNLDRAREIYNLNPADPASRQLAAREEMLNIARQTAVAGRAMLDIELGIVATPMTPGTRRRIGVFGDRNRTIDEAVVCVARDTGIETVRLPLRVTYRDVSEIFLSGAIITSLVRSHNFVAEARSGLDFNRRVIVDNAIRPQAVPFMLLNSRHSIRSREFILSGGIGLNLYDGVKADFAVGPSLNIRDFIVGVVAHFTPSSDLAGGFSTGDVLDAEQDVPTTRHWGLGLGISVGYGWSLR